ncbi:alpha/beta hydrolase [Phenylobacterium sp. J367]|uniref:alpha/beta hydrolase n=1 Tax=Phenylobacterium sp. J367 TaxID=2898435 RepID=UPI002151194E|nr:alpha/beta hydrolase [Phenylobacterium sp. J367]MCR5879474.1 alpha/beta hydrolase [Phenylobacterium sp. J367]
MSRQPLAATAFVLALGACAAAVAQPPAQPPADPGPPLSGYPRDALRPPTPAELKTATYVRDVIYGHRDGMALTYDVFKPVKGANGALVVNMVSAGWRSSWAPPEERQARYQALIDKGFTVVALYHSSAPRFQVPDAVSDVRLGMRHIKRHAADYGADPARIGVWGASAGGHLALVAGMMADDGDPAAANPLERSGNRVAAVVAYFPPTDLAVLLQGRPKGGAIAFDDSLYPAVSPIHSVDARDPPTLILHGDADRGVPPSQGEMMRAALDKVGVENELRMFAGADHDFYVKGDPAKTDAYATEAMKAMVGWFETRLKP